MKMKTLFDFITHVKGVEYIIAILFIGAFILFWEILKPKPFQKLVENGRDDLDHMKQRGVGDFIKSLGKLAAAPFIGLAYVIFLPIGFVAALSLALLKGIAGLAGANASFGWRPAEAYLGGKKKSKNKSEKTDTESGDE